MGTSQSLVKYILNILEVNPTPQSYNHSDIFTDGKVIILNFMYGSSKYQNADVKSAILLPVNYPNQTRIITIELND